MPRITITRRQREPIYGQLRRHLTTIDDIRVFADDDPEEAGRLALCIGSASLMLMAMGITGIGSASATPACVDVLAPTTSSDGTIVVTSPLVVQKVYGGEGSDVIYVSGEVEEIRGEGGDGESEKKDGGQAGDEVEATASEYEPIECAEKTSKGEPCYGGPGSQKVMGGKGTTPSSASAGMMPSSATGT